MAVKFADMMRGRKETHVGGRISPYTFLDQKSSDQSSRRVVGPAFRYTSQTNSPRSST